MVLSVLFYVLVSTSYGNLNLFKDRSFSFFDEDRFSRQLTQKVLENPDSPGSEIKFDNINYKVSFTTNERLTSYIKKMMKRYRSDYTSVVVIDNNNGAVLSAIDYDKSKKEYGNKITLLNTSPAASIFKVITAADLIENTEVSSETMFTYNGRGSTLYKYQLKNKKNKWTRRVPLEKAFAYSNNVIFGKAAINKLDDESLEKMAYKFGFNRRVLQLLKVGSSTIMDPKDDYNLAELASGFNRRTLMSPLQGAVIASIIANDGILKKPFMVNDILDMDTSRHVWKPGRVYERAISSQTASELREMMRLAVTKGTARGAFRPWKLKKLRNIEIGGKTGTITGGIPHGKRDWFASYAMPLDDENDKGLSICVMIINVDKWHIKSTYLAKKIIEYYYDELHNQSTGLNI